VQSPPIQRARLSVLVSCRILIGCIMNLDSRLPNFRSLTPHQRLRALSEAGFIPAADLDLLAKPGALPSTAADGMIENVIGTFELPLAVASNFRINGKDVVVPMAVEEPSI